MDIMADIIERVQRNSREAQQLLIEQAMLVEAPAIAAQGFEKYREFVAIDWEGHDYTMVCLMTKPGMPYQPIVLLIQDFSDVLSVNREIQMTIKIEPVLGERGWQRFQEKRARNNMPA